VRQSRSGTGLPLEASPGITLGQEILHNLDGDVPTEPRITRTIDLAHATRAERTLNLIRSEADADLKQYHRSDLRILGFEDLRI
jgi:hypothetical protein